MGAGGGSCGIVVEWVDPAVALPAIVPVSKRDFVVGTHAVYLPHGGKDTEGNQVARRVEGGDLDGDILGCVSA